MRRRRSIEGKEQLGKAECPPLGSELLSGNSVVLLSPELSSNLVATFGEDQFPKQFDVHANCRFYQTYGLVLGWRSRFRDIFERSKPN